MPELIGSRILLVDDDQQNRYVLTRVLERAQFVVIQASSGQQGLQLIQEQPDLVILDVKLPDMSGYDVCRRMKSDPRTSTIPVLQISAAFVSSESKAMALEGGADGYLTHPIESPVLVATVRSLLRLRRAEVQSRASAQEWQSTFDALSEAVAFIDPKGKLVRFNRACAELCGITQGSHPEKCLEAVIGAGHMRQIGEKELRLQQEVQHNDRWLRLTINPVRNAERYVGTVIVIQDFTERVRAEEALRESERFAATGRLAHTIAHEINNPLEALSNLIYLADYAAVNAQVKDYLRMASTELFRIARITKQVLVFNRDTSERVPVDLSDVIASALDLHAVPISTDGIRVSYDPGPPLFISGYPGQLRQVFTNLVGNAIEAVGKNGQITIRIKAVTLRKRGFAQVTIHDSGPGIPGALRQRVFEPFFTTKELKGSGLGLWLARSMIVKHEGSLAFKARTGDVHGTIFRLMLPTIPADKSVQKIRDDLRRKDDSLTA